jgi:hypothetical protein
MEVSKCDCEAGRSKAGPAAAVASIEAQKIAMQGKERKERADMVDMTISTFKVRIRVLLRRLEVCP